MLQRTAGKSCYFLRWARDGRHFAKRTTVATLASFRTRCLASYALGRTTRTVPFRVAWTEYVSHFLVFPTSTYGLVLAWTVHSSNTLSSTANNLRHRLGRTCDICLLL